jgi:hypothetical protein
MIVLGECLCFRLGRDSKASLRQGGRSLTDQSDTSRNISSPHPFPQHLSIIIHSFNQIDIGQRVTDGYVNATAMCKKLL